MDLPKSFNKITLPFLLIAFSIVFATSFILTKQAKNNHTTDINKIEEIDPPKFDGKILYSDNKSINLYNLQNQTTNTLVDDISDPDWQYQNGNIFYIKGNTIVRQDLKNNLETIEIIEPKDCQNQIGPYEDCFITNIYPSPDGQKIAFMLYTGPEDGGMGTLDDEYILRIRDFNKLSDDPITIKESKDRIGYPQNIVWFNNSRFIYIGDKLVFDTQSNNLKTLKDLNSDQIYSSFLGNNYLWFDNKGMKAKDRDIFDIYRPNLINSYISKTFPNSDEEKREYRDRTIPFINFPVIGRDFKGISRVIPTDGNFNYLLEITAGSGKRDIYFTDSGGTFKKINPNNSDSYYLVDYLSSRRQILASRVQEDRSYRRIVISSQLVLLNIDNYSEFVSNIDNDSSNKYYEKSIYINPNPSSYLSIREYMYAISPDEKYIIITLTQDNSEKYYFISLDDQFDIPLNISFGKRFFWLEN